ncbi:hypothetical protein YERSI8AC_190117 [Enterobacterales bacterium 8AC]|nr:hypothetical protein YERSI8AC_190117 [Enterobacterales bacterium 8AC]
MATCRGAPSPVLARFAQHPVRRVFFYQGIVTMLRRYLFEIILGTLIVCGLIAAFFYL